MSPRSYLIGRHIARMIAVARVEILHLIHDRMTISLVLLVPAVQIMLFGYAVNLNPKNVPLAIAGDGDRGRLAQQVRRTIQNTGYFTILSDGLERGDARRMVAEGKVLVGIELPPRADSGDGDTLSSDPKVVVDATDPAAVRPALDALQNAYWQQLAQSYAIGSVPSVDVEWLYNPERRTAWTVVHGLAGVIVMISMLMLGALTLVRERELGSWESLLTTPVDAIDVLIGKLSPYVIIGTVQTGVVILIAKLLFPCP
jgi:ABC-2 type transport system permease protein